MVLFIIYATTLGGAITLIGTPTNVFANGALEEVGLAPFAFFDFAWVGLPICIIGGIYLIVMHKWAASYDDIHQSFGSMEVTETKDLNRQRKQKIWVMLSFIFFVIGLVIASLGFGISKYTDPYMIAFFSFGLMFFFKAFTFEEIITGFPYRNVLFTAGILLAIRIVNSTGLGDAFGAVVLDIIGESTNLYFITSILFIGAAIVTQFMNNMACAGALAPIGISMAQAMGADPKAIVLTIAIGAGCSYLTPMASGTNQTLVAFTDLRFQDFAKFGWPLLIISYLCCVLILPQVFPFFP